MAALLLHSLQEFDEIILAALRALQPKEVLEIGSESGGMSRLLHDHCAQSGATLTVIEPFPTPELLESARASDTLNLVVGLSVEWMTEAGCSADLVLIDGDHNYWTVTNELRLIHEAWAKRGRAGAIFLHDVGFPWGRRDLYYAPELIPAYARHPHSWELGVTLDSTPLIRGGFRSCGAFALALEEGGERNGVLTAVEDFVKKHPEYVYRSIDAVFGLGALTVRDSIEDREIGALFAAYDNQLVRRLERNRLELYLKVLELQDQIAAGAAR